MNDADIRDLIVSILLLLTDYVACNPSIVAEETFHSTMIEEVCSLLDCTSYEFVEEICNDVFYEHFYPTRSFKSSFETQNFKGDIDSLRMLTQPTQRTDEWYTFRHNLITASNAFKMFGTESQRNSLIFFIYARYFYKNDIFIFLSLI
jgi:hypothetical protein